MVLTKSMILTEREAKKLSVKMWTYLAEHPSADKDEAIIELKLHKVLNMRSRCPLCQYHGGSEINCTKCVLCQVLEENQRTCYDDESHFQIWAEAIRLRDTATAKEMATAIRDAIKAWDVK